MRKHIITLLLLMMAAVSFGQQWVVISNDAPSTIRTQLIASSDNSVTVNLQVPGFYATEVTTPQGEANIISVPKTVSTASAGEPNLPMIAVPVLIGDRQHYRIRVVDAQYTDFTMEVAPSKGDFPRSINPEDVPYTYGEAYSTNAFFPVQNVSLYEPYILRDFRGQNMVVYPFAYNPVTHTLRVYHNMTVEMYSDGIDSQNIIDRRSNVVKMDPEIGAMYANHFINYGESLSRYTPIDETGELLIICHDAFMTAMQPFVNWKKQIGRPTTMVGTSTTGTSASAIKTYIQNQYNANSNLTHVLLVGDVNQILGNSYSAGSYGGKSDNIYGQVAGNDLYNDIIIGRFSAENEVHVTTQVNKVIHYERDINASDTWLTYGMGIGNNDGPGHFNEKDWEHIENIRTDLLAYNYTNVYQEYPGVSGYSSSSSIMSQHINGGVSIIDYCNHGSETSWALNSYSNSNVNALTNVNKLPIVWSVACLNGKYDHSQPCFGETWLRANNNSAEQPTGAVGGMFSYISQPWQPPMYGQDEMVDVLVESYGTNIKRTLGGCSYDGNMKILDQYGQSDNAAKGTYLAWILYGDPTLTLRNAVPANMNVTHASSMGTSATSFAVNATNGDGALASLTCDNEIMGSATIVNGTANITFTAPGTTGTATLTVFGYNKITYIATIDITGTEDFTQTISLTNGWNWLSTYIDQDGFDGLSLLEQGLGNAGVQIKSQSSYVMNYGGYWMGTLDAISNEETYLVKTNADAVVEMTGTPVDPSDHPITLTEGWNWIGFPCTTGMSLTEAFSNFRPANGDQVKAQGAFSQCYNGIWIGGLNSFDPGMGLMYYATNGGTIVYPKLNRDVERVENVTAEGNHWVPNMHAFSSNMTVLAVVELNDMELASDRYELGVFVDGVVCGSAKLMYVEVLDRYIAFLTIGGNGTAELYFGLYDEVTDKENFDSDDRLTYSADAMIGTPDAPIAIHFRNTEGISALEHSLQLYPNPVSSGESFSLSLPDTYKARVEIVNALGVVLSSETTAKPMASLKAPATAGVYTLRVTVEGKGVCCRKLVVK